VPILQASLFGLLMSAGLGGQFVEMTVPVCLFAFRAGVISLNQHCRLYVHDCFSKIVSCESKPKF
jgi:hypothetical protein